MPIVVPGSFQYIRYLGIDPGLNNTGVATLDQEYTTGKIVSIDAQTLVTDKLTDHSGLDEEYHPERAIKLMKLQMAIQQVLGYTQPAEVGCEAPFFNRLRPMAYGALMEVVNVINFGVMSYNSNTCFTLFPPLSVKKVVGAKSVANNTEKGKYEVKEAIRNNPEIMAALVQNIDELSEHALDAVAVAYTLAKYRSTYHAW